MTARAEYVGVGGTIDLDGLPPPPAGVTSSSTKNKRMDNYKAGQCRDAIKWLFWAVILFEKNGDNVGIMEFFSSGASWHKEVGEYKKAAKLENLSGEYSDVLENYYFLDSYEMHATILDDQINYWLAFGAKKKDEVDTLAKVLA
ncbi:hypothetical protein LXL04_005377 [Taraxacum kok-saghyz]